METDYFSYKDVPEIFTHEYPWVFVQRLQHFQL